MSKRYDCRDPQERIAGIDAAMTAARAGELIVLPTDTVYGIGADAFIPPAVRRLLAAKGRGRQMPPPVLIADGAGRGGAGGRPRRARPGRSTSSARRADPDGPRQPDARWDLGDTRGTVALRMPLHSVALDVLKQTGPLAVSSANRHGQPSAISADESEHQLGEAVSIYLDGGPCTDNVPSTILDLTGTVPKVLRSGAISVDRLRAVSSVIAENEHYPEAVRRQARRAAPARAGNGGPRDR